MPHSLAPAAGSFGQRIEDVAEPKCTKAYGGNAIRTVCVAETGSKGKWQASEKCIGIHCDIQIILSLRHNVLPNLRTIKSLN